MSGLRSRRRRRRRNAGPRDTVGLKLYALCARERCGGMLSVERDGEVNVSRTRAREFVRLLALGGEADFFLSVSE